MPAIASHQELIDLLKSIQGNCTLCPRKCRIDRTKGETGFCGLTDEIIMDCALPHHGEEPPFSGTNGAGTIFLSSCNLRCCYCQNHQISMSCIGKRLDGEGLADVMLSLQEQGCHNIEPVTPTPQIPGVIKAFSIARGKGLVLPMVFNCGGYENPEIIRLLDGFVDVYLPDFKYGLDETGRAFSGVADYVSHAVESIREMVNQVGDNLEVKDGVAFKGIVIRHLVLPGAVENSLAVLDFVSRHISTAVPMSIMSQYAPTSRVRSHHSLCRRVTAREYETVIDYALDLGFQNLFIQDVHDESSITPDFAKDKPFKWE